MPDLSPEQRRDARELEAAQRRLARLRHERGLEPAPEAHEPATAPGRSGRSRWVLGAVVAGTAVALSGLTSFGGDDADAVRYDRPPHFTPGEGSHQFLATQPGGDEPIGFDPCRPIRYLVNPEGAPPDWRELIATGAAHTEWASGLDLVNAGTTARRPFNPFQYDGALGEMPVIIGFADEVEQPGLSGDVVGLGGPIGANRPVGRWYWTSGSISLDTEAFAGPSSGSRRALLQAVVDHEFGHVVGLDHVDDPAELMHESNVGVTHYGPGDLEGMDRLGSIPCR